VSRGGWIAVASVVVFFLACTVIAILIDWRISYR
jgi:hypothetical protein